MMLPRDTTILLQDQQGVTPRWLRFGRPLEVIQCGTPAAIMQCLLRIEERVNSGLYAAGFISYEASSGFDNALQTHAATDLPCLWFGIFEHYEEVELPAGHGPGRFHLDEWAPSVSWQQYHRAIEKIKHHIREGDTYQVNYTFRLHSRFDGDPLQLFCHLYQAQRSCYSAYVDLGKYRICSVSPEIFLSLNGSRLLCKPMKGTLRRGYTDAQDHEAVQWLHSSPKDRAENVMIVDMIRNDMGRIAETGSVEVSRLFEIEKYPTVHQMTSTVRSTTAASITEILQTTFPCASITGAPKVKTWRSSRQWNPMRAGFIPVP
jgi:para-aminobenzoate synthetase/4-amino-4-deoxychorismate lyase